MDTFDKNPPSTQIVIFSLEKNGVTIWGVTTISDKSIQFHKITGLAANGLFRCKWLSYRKLVVIDFTTNCRCKSTILLQVTYCKW